VTVGSDCFAFRNGLERRSGRNLAITVEPLRELTATQHRQLEDEVELLGAVMEANPTLAVGTVTVGPHA